MSGLLKSGSALQPLRSSKIPARTFQNSRRSLHRLKELSYKTDKGLGSFMSEKTLQSVAVDYQEGLLDRLNERLKETGHRHQSVFQTLTSYATNQQDPMVFNYASEALNNTFFLEHLKPVKEDLDPDFFGNEGDLENRLLDAIQNSFGSLANLKSSFSATAMGMFGSGWVWLVQKEAILAVVPTFAGGSMLIHGREAKGISRFGAAVMGEQIDSQFTSSTISNADNKWDVFPSGTTRPGTRSFSTSAARASTYAQLERSRPYSVAHGRPGQLNTGIVPLFCISVHERSWINDHGVWGKEEYLKHFWEVLDWGKVSRSYLTTLKTESRASYKASLKGALDYSSSSMKSQ